MSDQRYIAAIEISSSKVIAAVGKTSGDGLLDVIAVEQEKGTESVRYGIIQNLEETSLKVSRVIDRLQRRSGISPKQIKGLFVGLSGRSVRSIPTEVSLSLPDDTEITDEVLERMRTDAMHSSVGPTLEVIDAVPRIYRIGKIETTSPKGTVGNFIRATFDLIVCRPELKRNLTRTIQDKLGIRIEGFVVTSLAAGHLLLSTEEKRLGCMLVDMGAETTPVSIYSKGYLKYFATLPLGGRNITHDITNLGLLEEAAEEIKKTSGSAIPPETPSILNLNGVRYSDVSNLVVARAEEIVVNIVQQIEYAFPKDLEASPKKESERPAKIICIGGGARLQNMMDLLGDYSKLPVQRGVLPKEVIIEDPKATTGDMEGVISVLYAGATLSNRQCLEDPEKKEIPVTGSSAYEAEPEPEPEHADNKPARENKFFQKLKTRISNIFSGPEDDSDILE